MTRYDLTTVGEGQLRLSVPVGDRLSSARELELTAAGSEANVAGVLAQLGRSTAWASVLPEGPVAERVLAEYRSVGVDLSLVRRTPQGRVAIYFLEAGDGALPGRVTYDREGTPFRDITVDDVDWDALLDTRVLLVTGITAALTDRTATLVAHAVQAAAQRGATVALDVNHRSTLWSEERARATLEPMLVDVEVLFCSRTDGNRVFGIEGDGAAVCVGLRERYGVAQVVTTDRVAGVHCADEAGLLSLDVPQVSVVDRPGAGDAFVAGCLHGLLDGDLRAGLQHGLRTASLALTHRGDLTRLNAADLLLRSDTDIVR